MTDTATAQRPPARPTKRSSPSRSQARHHLEPNPFEKSFSSGPSDTPERRPDSKADANKISSTSTPPLSTRPGAAYRDRNPSTPKTQTSPSGGGQDSTSTPKPLLPPVASITSPASEANQYPWAAGLTSSLRSGPLSPAMLAGPQSSHFDPSTFRTGFTPDLSNFKTGLTPLGGGLSFPPPSPNTAAFLAAMVNSTSSTSAATITPNTLSALSGNPVNPLDASTGANGLSSQPQNFGGKPIDSHDQFDLAFSRTFGADGSKAAQPGSKLKASIENNDTDSSISQSVSPQMMQKPLGPLDASAQQQQQQQATQAASGLFLLSQAQQEISKREGSLGGPNGAAFAAANAPTSLYESTNTNKGAKGGNPKGAKGGAAAGGNKRKKGAAASANGDDAQSAAGGASNGKKAKTGAKKAASETSEQAGGAPSGKRNSLSGDDHFDDGSGDESGGENNNNEGGKNGGNMDDKRKNFLERNRQAALKCRQRKKAWLASLQAKVEYLQNDNENLQNTVGALRNEIMFLKSQLVQANGGAPPGVPMSMPMGMGPMGPHPHPDPHHSMGQPGMPIPAGMGPPHPAYMHPATSGPPHMTQAPHQAGMYSAHAVPRPANMPPHNPNQPGYPHDMRGRPRSEGDIKRDGSTDASGSEGPQLTDQPMGPGPIKHEREWSNPAAAAAAAADTSKNREVSAATIKV
ncbi:uncharacterized protein PFL1_04831 [Pseudozyma flocculosa PF-1]|uniref:Related to transcription factor ATFA n=2 Tax=Pseudozyma flocculosa TaxID=84751 RepID=A0A5C3F4B8_9BASI|nr:uncharacterized protein PFL1_04831 [Pseudozyma flocculosa PF-1]EPQ27693.1 hypothetical protein PFL1_04831 [Pseudozyma flocculosa PF-1]SPO39172.1 related to transcription factor ATFA [Pseudozyma flocculosa]